MTGRLCSGAVQHHIDWSEAPAGRVSRVLVMPIAAGNFVSNHATACIAPTVSQDTRLLRVGRVNAAKDDLS